MFSEGKRARSLRPTFEGMGAASGETLHPSEEEKRGAFGLPLRKGRVQMRPRFVRSERIFWTAFFASSGFFPPVMMSFPDPKRRTTTLGSSSR